MPVLARDPRALRARAPARRAPDRRLPAHHRGDREPRAGAARGRRRGRAVRREPALDAGRRRRGARRRATAPRVLGTRGEDRAAYERHLRELVDARPQILIDDGAELIVARPRAATPPGACSARPRRRRPGSCGCARWRPPGRCAARCSRSTRPRTERIFNDRYGTGQSTLDGILRATNLLLAGRAVVVLGYGSAGPRRRRSGRRARAPR